MSSAEIECTPSDTLQFTLTRSTNEPPKLILTLTNNQDQVLAYKVGANLHKVYHFYRLIFFIRYCIIGENDTTQEVLGKTKSRPFEL